MPLFNLGTFRSSLSMAAVTESNKRANSDRPGFRSRTHLTVTTKLAQEWCVLPGVGFSKSLSTRCWQVKLLEVGLWSDDSCDCGADSLYLCVQF